MIGIETSCLSQTIRGIGIYTFTLIEALKRQNQDLIFIDDSFKSSIPFANSFASFFRTHCFGTANLIHFPTPKILYGKRPKIPIILTIHDIMPLLFPQFFSIKSRLMMEVFLPRYLRDANAISCPSRQTKKDLLNIFSLSPEKIHVIPLALLPKKRLLQQKKDPFLLYIGSFEPRKNIPGILKAFAILRKEKFFHKLILAGKEEGKHCIPKDLLWKLQIQDHVIIKGYISEEEKDLLLQKCALLLWPSFYEGFGIPLLEAMAAGTPIVTSDSPTMREVTHEAASYANPYDPEDIANAAKEILSSQKKTLFLAEKGRKRAAKFSIENFGRRHIDLYKKILQYER